MVAPDARVMPMRVLDSDGIGTVFSVAEALYDATDAGAQVINLSLGTPEKLESEVLKKALEWARKRQVVVVAAAGQRGLEAEAVPGRLPRRPLRDRHHRGRLRGGEPTRTPAAGSTWRPSGTAWSVRSPAVSYGRWSGTSMSTPVVAGQIALLRSLRPGVKSDKILEAVFHTCRKLAKTEMKEGRVDLAASLAFLLDKNK